MRPRYLIIILYNVAFISRLPLSLLKFISIRQTPSEKILVIPVHILLLKIGIHSAKWSSAILLRPILLTKSETLLNKISQLDDKIRKIEGTVSKLNHIIDLIVSEIGPFVVNWVRLIVNCSLPIRVLSVPSFRTGTSCISLFSNSFREVWIVGTIFWINGHSVDQEVNPGKTVYLKKAGCSTC